MSKYYEIIIFTASLKKYAEPLIAKMDEKKVIAHKLYREDCICIDNVFVKDLSRLGRELKNVIIVDVRSSAEFTSGLYAITRKCYPNFDLGEQSR